MSTIYTLSESAELASQDYDVAVSGIVNISRRGPSTVREPQTNKKRHTGQVW